MKYTYWFKQQTVSFTVLSIALLAGYTFAITTGWGSTELVITKDLAIKMLAVALSHIFIVPFFFKWWDITNEQNLKF